MKRPLSGRFVQDGASQMMTLTPIVNILAWLVCGVYATIPTFWLLIHPFADWWRSRFRAPLKVIGSIWVLIWIIAWAASYPWMQAKLHVSPWFSLLAIPFWGVSLFVYFGGKRHFTLTQVIGRSELESDRHPQLLVTTGLHAHMRHPLYLGHLCTMTGWFFVARTEAVLGLLIWGAFTGIAMVHAEDAELERRFGLEYREYRRRVPSVFPKLF